MRALRTVFNLVSFASLLLAGGVAQAQSAHVEVFDVDAVVTPQPMPVMLLGNSFLTRFQMLRENDQMRLTLTLTLTKR